MNGDRKQRLGEIIDQAGRLPAGAREEFVRVACGGDGELEAEARSLLAAVSKAGGFLARPTVEGGIEVSAAETSMAQVREGPGTMVGRYTLLEQIGEGGFGVVFMAEQREPVQRRVALKIIKLGMDTRQVVARFEAERQALAVMDHPCIAKVLDGGATESGRPYFVMELVVGEPIVAYCDAAGLSTAERLELFAQVCHAAQHAHTKGIIHRDIKPSNVLVAAVDGRATPRIIDFGIAKATSARLTEKTLFTEHRQMIGTPAYMSPEQAEASGQDIDARTDIYSLGVLLYELLTGVTPFDPERLRSAAYAEMQRIIREDEPPKPSTRLSTLKDTLASIAAQRHTEPGRLASLVRGDLDWIVMRCLEKDRSRRYETANALAVDVLHHLAGEPVSAAPPSAGYRTRKFVRRHRAGVAAGIMVGAALVAGLGVALWQAGVARRERDAQRASAAEAMRAKREADESRKESEQIAEFQGAQLQGIDTQLMGVRLREDLLAEAEATGTRSGSGPADGGARSAGLAKDLAGLNLTNVALESLHRNIFQRAIEAIDKDFADRPLIQARLLATTGRTLATLGLYSEAINAHRRALGIRREQLGEEDGATLESYNDLGYAQTMRGEYTEGEANLRVAIDGRRRVLGEDAKETLTSRTSLAASHKARARLAEAETEYLDVLARLRRADRAGDADVLARVMGDLAVTLMRRGKLEDAQTMSREARELCRREYGEEDGRTLIAGSNLAAVLLARGDLPGATALTAEVLASSRRVLGDSHPSVLIQLSNLGVMLTRQNRFDEAEPPTREALTRLRDRLGESHPDTLTALNNLGVLLTQRGRFVEAAEALGDGVRLTGGGGESVMPSRAILMHHQAEALRMSGELDGAKRLARESVEMYASHPDWSAGEAQHATTVLDAVLLARADYPEQEALVRVSLERARQATPVVEADVAGALAQLALNLLAQKRFADAEAAARECIDIRARLFPEGDPGRWRYHYARSMLGGALVGRAGEGPAEQRIAALREAEGLLVGSYEAIKDDPQVAPPTIWNRADRKLEALQRVVEMYGVWDGAEPGKGYDAKAAEWKSRLNATGKPAGGP